MRHSDGKDVSTQMMSAPTLKDHWTKEAYTASATFVPQLTNKVVNWLDPQPTDRILDLGCGDGVLSAKIKDHCASVTGLDSSQSMIRAARTSYNSTSGLSWQVQDCRYIEHCEAIETEAYTKVFSNAALHWILRDPATRVSVLRGAFRALERGGKFAFETGGPGNVAEGHAALLAAVVHQGVSIEHAREAVPWFFPSEALMRKLLEGVGFVVEMSEIEYRPTRLTTEKGGGIEGWVRLMGAQILEVLRSAEKQEAAIQEVCNVLSTILTHDEDSSMWLGYVRLRVLVRKP